MANNNSVVQDESEVFIVDDQEELIEVDHLHSNLIRLLDRMLILAATFIIAGKP